MRVRLKQVALVAVAPIRVPARHLARAICGDPLATGFRLTIVIWAGRKLAGCRRLPPFVLVHEERYVRRHVFEKLSSNARSSRVLVAPDDAAEAAPLVRRDDQFDPSRHPIRLLEGDLEALRARTGLCPCVQVADKVAPTAACERADGTGQRTVYPPMCSVAAPMTASMKPVWIPATSRVTVADMANGLHPPSSRMRGRVASCATSAPLRYDARVAPRAGAGKETPNMGDLRSSADPSADSGM